MESTKKDPGIEKTKFGSARSSHSISKLKAVTASTTRIIPTIRIVQIFSPQVFETDPANFRALVQKLTGKKSKPRKMEGGLGSKKSDSLLMEKNIVQAQLAESHSEASTVIGQNFTPSEVSETEEHMVTPDAGIERNSFNGDGVQVCDNFSELFGGLDELNFLSSLEDSLSSSPELPTIYPPPAVHIEYNNSRFGYVSQ